MRVSRARREAGRQHLRHEGVECGAWNAPELSARDIVVPGDSNTLYICALQKTADVLSRNGGVWKSNDGGQTWLEIFTDPAYSLTVHPENPNRLLISSWYGLGDGIYTSPNGGTTWTRMKIYNYDTSPQPPAGEDYPFWRPLKTVFHPDNPSLIYITNYL